MTRRESAHPAVTVRSGSGAETRLATYGTLSPGERNHAQLAGLRGRWLRGTVRGRIVRGTSGPGRGYPGLILDPDGPEIAVHVLASPQLPRHWARLDDFEGKAYRRVATPVRTRHGAIAASIYVITDAFIHAGA